MRHRTHRADSNQDAIVKRLREIGASVLVMSQLGDGAPDLLVGWRGANFLLEIKNGNGKLRMDQEKFSQVWRGKRPDVVRTWQEAFDKIGAVNNQTSIL